MASEACCEREPVGSDYSPSGRYDTVGGLKTYIVGPETSATKAIIDVYDAFGMASQTIRGADHLSELIGDCIVLVPDFFEGEAADPAWFGGGSVAPNAKEAAVRFMSTKAGFSRNGAALLKVRREVGERWPGVEAHVGVFGLCWGGKIAALVCGEDNQGKGRHFTVSGTAHPARLDTQDAEALNVPYICLASPGEPADVVAQIGEILSRPGRIAEVETYGTMFHGWMGARADLEDKKNAEEYARGYSQVATFFAKHI